MKHLEGLGIWHLVFGICREGEMKYFVELLYIKKQ